MNSLLHEFEYMKNDDAVFMDSTISNRQLPYGYHSIEKPLQDEIQKWKNELAQLQERYDELMTREYAPLKNSYVELMGDLESNQRLLQELNVKYDSVVNECDHLRKKVQKYEKQQQQQQQQNNETNNNKNLNDENGEEDEEDDDDDDDVEGVSDSSDEDNDDDRHQHEDDDTESELKSDASDSPRLTPSSDHAIRRNNSSTLFQMARARFDSNASLSSNNNRQNGSISRGSVSGRRSTNGSERGPEKIDLDDHIVTPREVRKRLPSIHHGSRRAINISYPLAVNQGTSSGNSGGGGSPRTNDLSPKASNTSCGGASNSKKISTGQYFIKSLSGKLLVEYPFNFSFDQVSRKEEKTNSGSVKASIIITDKFYEEPVDCLVVSNTKDLSCSSATDAFYAKQLNDLCKSSTDNILSQCQEYLSQQHGDSSQNQKMDQGGVFCGHINNSQYVVNVFVADEPLKGITPLEDSANRIRMNCDPIYRRLNPAVKNVLQCADGLSCTSIAFSPIIASDGSSQYSVSSNDWITGYRCMFLSMCEYFAENKISTNLLDIRVCVNSQSEAQLLKKALDIDFISYIERSRLSHVFPPAIRSLSSSKSYEEPPPKKKEAQEIEPKDPRLYYATDYATIQYEEKTDDSENIEFMGDATENNSDAAESPDIKCATLDKLIERVTYHSTYDNSYLYAFLLTYRSFTTPQELLEKLIQRYNIPPPHRDSITHKEFGEWQHDVLNKVRLRVSQVIKKWIENHYYDFENDSDLVQKVVDLTNMMKETQGSAFATQIQRALQKQQSNDSSRSIVVFDRDDASVPKSLCPKQWDGIKTVDLLQWPSGELARQITLLEYQMFHGLQPKECLNQNWNKSHREEKAPNIFMMINWFNTVSRWVASCVVQEDNPKKRKLALTKMIHLAEACYELNNFNAIFEIISGLQNAAVHRLKKTWEMIGTRERKEYERMLELVSRNNNYRAIRRAILDVKPPCIPYIGVFLTDLTFIEDGNPDFLNNKINFIKRRKLALLIRDIQTYQQTPYKLHHLPQLQEQLKAMQPLAEDQLYDKSLIIEPRKKQA